jgi:hypothetical protein
MSISETVTIYRKEVRLEQTYGSGLFQRFVIFVEYFARTVQAGGWFYSVLQTYQTVISYCKTPARLLKV